MRTKLPPAQRWVTQDAAAAVQLLDYTLRMFAALMIGHHLSISAF
jgi:hypothetical protein